MTEVAGTRATLHRKLRNTIVTSQSRQFKERPDLQQYSRILFSRKSGKLSSNKDQ